MTSNERKQGAERDESMTNEDVDEYLLAIVNGGISPEAADSCHSCGTELQPQDECVPWVIDMPEAGIDEETLLFCDYECISDLAQEVDPRDRQNGGTETDD